MAKFKIYVKRKWIYQGREPVAVDVCIKNISNRDYYISTTGTPFEGVPHDCFKVTRNGTQVPYDGIRIKRAGKDVQSYYLMRAGEVKVTRIYLSELYSMNESGIYQVKLKIETLKFLLRSSADNQENSMLEERIPEIKFSFYRRTWKKHWKTGGERLRDRAAQNRSRYRTVNVDFPEPTVIFHPMQPKENEAEFIKKVLNAHFEMIHYLKHCKNELENTKVLANNTHYQLAFGAYAEANYKKVIKIYGDILEKLRTTIVVYERNTNLKDEDCVAYTTYQSDTIYLAKDFWELSVTGEDSHLGTLLHEWTHAVANTDDHEYGRETCFELAAKKPECAIHNADNFELFLESKFLHWNYGGIWRDTMDVKKTTMGGPSLISDGEQVYLFYCSKEGILKMAVYDGTTFQTPIEMENAKKEKLCSEYHPEAVRYRNTIYVFFTSAQDGTLCYTSIEVQNKTLICSETKPVLEEGKNLIIPVYPPNPVVYQDKIKLIYKKEGEYGFYETSWGKMDLEWSKEGEIPNQGALVEIEQSNPAVMVIHNILYLVYRSETNHNIKYAYFDTDNGIWKIDHRLEQCMDRYTTTEYEIRGVTSKEGAYLLTRFPEQKMGQIQVNYLSSRQQVMWTDGENLENNIYPKQCIESESICAMATLEDYNYVIGIQKGEPGIFYCRQIS